MLHFFIGLFIIFTSIAAETTEKKIVQMDALKAPNVYMSDTRFIFEGLIISLLKSNNHAYLAFDLEMARDTTNYLRQQEDEIPSVIDTLISDLTPSLGLFWNGKTDGLQDILTKRITKSLGPKFKWIQGIQVSNVRVQVSTSASL
jgi:hypothetical protein